MGFSVITTTLSPAANRLLTNLQAIKTELSIDYFDTRDDAWLSRAIRQISSDAELHCARPFAPELIQDQFDIEQDPYPYQTPGGFPRLQLSRWPVLAVVSVVQTLAVGLSPASSNTQTLTAGVDYRVDPRTGEIMRLNKWTGSVTLWEPMPVTVVYTAGFGALVTETQSVPTSAPFTVTVSQADSYSCTQAVAYANGTSLSPVAANPAQGQFSVSAAGVYTLAAADEGQAIGFTYATVNLPESLVGIAHRLVTERYADKGRSPNLVQRDTPGVGTERFWMGGVPGQKGPFPPDVEAALDYYRTPVCA